MRLRGSVLASGRTEKSGREKKKVHGGINGIPGVDAANYDAGSCLGSAVRVHRAGPRTTRSDGVLCGWGYQAHEVGRTVSGGMGRPLDGCGRVEEGDGYVGTSQDG
jgi:hypothetical protein